MYLTIDDDGNTVEHYEFVSEYRSRGYDLQRTGGRSQIIYEGWQNGELIRILRK